jgi:flagellar hook-associated protein 3 FlgL
MAQVGQWQRNIAIAHTDLSVTESVLDRLTAVLSRAQELAIQADSSALDATGRAQIASEVENLLQEVMTLANTAHNGRRIFAGHQTQTVPFVEDVPGHPTAIAYQGDGGEIVREIGNGERLVVNLGGEAVFGDVFEELISFRDALHANDQPAAGAMAATMGNLLDATLQHRGDVGARVRRLELAEQRLGSEDMRLRILIADLEEADITEEIVELQMREVAFQAALSATGRSLNLSLLDFLR